MSKGYVDAVAVMPAPAPAKNRMKALHILLPECCRGYQNSDLNRCVNLCKLQKISIYDEGRKTSQWVTLTESFSDLLLARLLAHLVSYLCSPLIHFHFCCRTNLQPLVAEK
jgi:hypothetical protein